MVSEASPGGVLAGADLTECSSSQSSGIRISSESRLPSRPAALNRLRALFTTNELGSHFGALTIARCYFKLLSVGGFRTVQRVDWQCMIGPMAKISHHSPALIFVNLSAEAWLGF